jgi:hypothetical protein
LLNPTWLFVAAVYAIAVLLARWAKAEIPVRIAVLFYALVLICFFRPMTQDSVNLQVDYLATLPPWDKVLPRDRPNNGQMNDIPLCIVPWAHLVRESWLSLKPPLWNPAAGCGSALLGNAQSAALSPLRILTLPLSLGHAMTAEAAIKILIALTGMFLYCRRHWSEWAALLGAVSFGFGGFLFAWLHFPHATTACLLPFAVYFVELFIERQTYRRFVGVIAVWTAVILSGQPETAAHMFVFTALYVLWLRPPMRVFLKLAGALVLAGLLSAPYIAVFTETMLRSNRFTGLQEKPFSAEELAYSDWTSAVVLLQPRFYGPWYYDLGPSDADGISGYAGLLGAASWIAIIIFVIRSKAWSSREAFYAAMTLFVIGAIFNWPLFSHFCDVVLPIVAHHRLRLILVFVLAVQAAAALDLARQRETRPLLVGIAVVATGIIALHLLYTYPKAPTSHLVYVLRAAVPGGLSLLIAVVALTTRRPIALAALVATVVFEMWTMGRDFNAPTSSALLYPRTPIISKLQELKAASREPFRILGHGAMIFQNTPGMYGLEDMRAHDPPMANSQYLNFLAKTSEYGVEDYIQMLHNLDTHVIDFLNVKYVVTDVQDHANDLVRYRPVYEGPDGRIFENTSVLPRFFAARNVIIEFDHAAFERKLGDMDDKWSHTALLDELEVENRQMHDDFFKPRPEVAPIATVELLDEKGDEYRMRVRSPRYSLIVGSIPWWPGWKVERNGVRIDPIRVNGAFLGFAVPPGVMDVRVWYDPWTWRVGVVVALATIIGLMFLGYLWPRRA